MSRISCEIRRRLWRTALASCTLPRYAVLRNPNPFSDVSPATRWIVLAAVLLFAGYVIYGTVTRTQVSCEVCLDFEGETVCRRGAGATEEEARGAAQESACGGQARGMSEIIACRNQEPVRSQCSTG